MIAPTDNHPQPSNLYRNFVLAMLTLVYVFNFIDRQLLVILQESIKKELHLSDTQLGMLSGFTFAVFYVTLGIPVAHLADRSNRRNIVAASLGLWSIMTAICGISKNFFQLLLARIGVGVGEAGGSPPAHAMISDYFPAEKRSTALSVYSTGIYIGILVGFLMGGYLNQHLGWRTAFFTIGVPGIIFSVILLFTVKEPQRGATETGKTATTKTPSLMEVLKLLYSKKTFVYLAAASGLHVFCIYGLLNWAGSFYTRLHNMNSADAGAALGLIFGIGGAIGTFAGGYLTDHYGKINKQWYLKIPAFAIVVSILVAALGLFVKNTAVSMVGIGSCALLQSMYLGPAIAVSHNLVPPSMRAMTSAIFFLVINLVGLGLGPLTVGFISDQLKPSLGVDSLRWGMCVTLPIALISAILFFIAAKSLSRSPSINS